MGQDAGLINEILSAGEIVRRVAEEALNILSRRLPRALKEHPGQNGTSTAFVISDPPGR